jgi:hypothetical protein
MLVLSVAIAIAPISWARAIQALSRSMLRTTS